MRLDKFLKNSRIIKRRPVAKEISDKGRVKVNGQTAKAGTNLKSGDQLEILFASKTLVLRVEELIESTRKEDASKMYTIIEERPNENNSDLE